MDSRTKEHLQSQDTDIARRSSVPKRHVLVTHPGMASQTRGTLGGPTQGNPPDASSPSPTDPSRQGKSFAVPAITHGMSSCSDRGHYDPSFAHAIFSEASRDVTDFARDLHTALPGAGKED